MRTKSTIPPHESRNDKCPASKGIITTLLQGMAFIGLLLSAYGVALLIAESRDNKALEDFLMRIRSVTEWISVSLTLIGLFLVALSGYFTPSSRDPDPHSLKIVAPSVILLVLLAVGTMIHLGKPLNEPTVLGLAILSLSGATLRALPFSEQQPDTFSTPLFRPWPWWRTESTAKPKIEKK